MRIVKVKTSQGSLGKNIGTELAPDLILADLKSDEAKIYEGNLEETNKSLENVQGDLFVGGDHSITYPLFRAFAKDNKGKRIGLIIFDAHPDCVSNFLPPTHEDFVRVLIEEGSVRAENVLLVGLRKIDSIEKRFMKEKGVSFILSEELKNKKEMLKKITDFAGRFESFYLSLDIDVLDPKFAPGTGYPETGGINMKELVYFVSPLVKSKKIGRCDLVEANPLKDFRRKTIKNAQRIVKIIVEN